MAQLEHPRVLILEDDYYLAQALTDEVQAVGGEVVGPLASLSEALEAVAANPTLDIAIVDLELRDGVAFPVLDMLLDSEAKVVITFSHGRLPVPERYAHVPQWDKPVDRAKLLALLSQA